MKISQVYIVQIKPKEFTPLTIGFQSKPTKEKIIEAITDILNKAKQENTKKLCKRCVQGINTWGISLMFENNESVTHWKDKGVSLYSSKGQTLIKVMNCYN